MNYCHTVLRQISSLPTPAPLPKALRAISAVQAIKHIMTTLTVVVLTQLRLYE